MPIITLITDFGYKDPFVASVKAKIYSELENVNVVDVSHSVEPFDIAEGAFIIKNSYKDFPKGTIHIIGVDSLIHPLKRPIAALIDGHYFISSDNGILSLINAEVNPTQIVEINIPQVNLNSVFVTRDIFVPVACHLARGGNLAVVGQYINEFKELSSLRAVVKDNKTIIGTVVYIDNYGNSITNVTADLFEKVGKKREFIVRFRNHEFNTIYRNYNEVVRDFENESADYGRGMALFGSSGYLEIAMYKGNPQNYGAASTLYGLKKGSEIHIDFF